MSCPGSLSYLPQLQLSFFNILAEIVFRFVMLRTLLSGAGRPNSCRLCFMYGRYKYRSFQSVRLCSNLADKLEVLSEFSCHIQPVSGTEISSPGQLTKPDNRQILNVFDQFRKNELVAELAYEQGMSDKIFTTCLKKFQSYLTDSTVLPEDINFILNDIVAGYRSPDDIFPYFLQHSKRIYPVLSCFSDLQKITNLTNPANWYPKAREMKRKVIFHAGPTNSGKTYGAVQSFYASEKALYAAPLRLLATEIYMKCGDRDINCDLITGEDQRFVNADRSSCGHTACTVEMVNVNETYDSVVIDEIQMLKDEQRGYAWTRALLGAATKELHVCGEPAAVNLVRDLVETCGDEFEVHDYERLTPLCFEDRALESWSEVQKGDCIIAFGRNARFAISAQLDKLGVKYATIYGALPPKTKIEQAKAFNDPDSGVDVLVASDAIGLGLNLEIRRIIFSQVVKANRELPSGIMKSEKIPQALANQIAGRAGRFGSAYDFGHVTAFGHKNLKTLKEIAGGPVEAIKKAGIAPTAEQIQLFAYHLPEYSLKQLLEIFNRLAQTDENFFACPSFEFKDIAQLLEDIDMSLIDKYTFCLAPSNVGKSAFEASMMLKYAKYYSKGRPVRVGSIKNWIRWPIQVPQNRGALESLENVVSSLEVYLWLSFKFPSIFDDYSAVVDLTNDVSKLIDKGLEKLKLCKISMPVVEKKGAFVARAEKLKKPRAVKSALQTLQAELKEKSGNNKLDGNDQAAVIVENQTDSLSKVIGSRVGYSKQNRMSKWSEDDAQILEPHNFQDIETTKSNLSIEKFQDNYGVLNANKVRSFHCGDPPRIFGRIRRTNAKYLQHDLKALQYYMMGQPGLLRERVDLILQLALQDQMDKSQFIKTLARWHSIELLTWFMFRYPQLKCKYEEVLQKKQKFEAVLESFVSSMYFEHFKLLDSESKPASHSGGSHLLGYCLKKSRFLLDQYNSSGFLDTEGYYFDRNWFEAMLSKTLHDPRCKNGSSIDDAFQFLKVLNKNAYYLFPECEPENLIKLENEVREMYSAMQRNYIASELHRYTDKPSDQLDDVELAESGGARGRLLPIGEYQSDSIRESKSLEDLEDIDKIASEVFSRKNPSRVFDSIKFQIISMMSHLVHAMQNCLLCMPDQFKKSVEIALKIDTDRPPNTNGRLRRFLLWWHRYELMLWFMKRYPKHSFKALELKQKQHELETLVQPYVPENYFEKFRVNDDSVTASANENGSHLLGSCLKRSRQYFQFYESADEVSRKSMATAFSNEWMEEKLKKTLKNPPNCSTREAVSESIEFLKVLNKFAYFVFPKSDPINLKQIENRLLEVEATRKNEYSISEETVIKPENVNEVVQSLPILRRISSFFVSKFGGKISESEKQSSRIDCSLNEKNEESTRSKRVSKRRRRAKRDRGNQKFKSRP